LSRFNSDFSVENFGDREEIVNSVRKTVPIFIGILILASSSGIQFAPSIIQPVHAEPAKRIVGYLPYWESGDFDSIDYSKLTDVIYFHIWPKPDGTLDTSVINQNDLDSIRSKAHAEGVNVLIAIGGWGVSDSFPEMAQNNAIRANFVSHVVSFVIENNLDGADIDWETPIDQNKIDYQEVLLADLSDALYPLGKLLTVAANAEVVELKSSSAYSVDWVNLMAYDMNWGNAEHSTLADSISALERYQEIGIPKEKLALGIPFYGRDNNGGAIKYQDIVLECNPEPTSNYCGSYFFNGIDLVNQKAHHVLNGNYFGVMIWNLGQDTYDQTSLLNSINETFSGNSLPITIHLENLEIGKTGGKRWSATVTITVFDQNNNAVSGATVEGVWSGGSVGNGSCVTDATGQCTVSQSTRGNNLTFKISDISGTRLTYDSIANTVSNTISINKDGSISGQNSSPVADSGGPYTAQINSRIMFDGSGSSDSDGDSLTYLWQFGDGNTSNQVNPSHSYTATGIYEIILQVTDSKGESNTDTTTATISTQTSNLTIDSISPNLMIKGQTITAVILGEGFDQDVTVKFQGGKYAPTIISKKVNNDKTIELEITSSTAGPKRDFVYDVTVINPNGETFTLPQSFTVMD